MTISFENIQRVANLKQITNKIGSGATPRGGKNSYKRSGVALIRSLNVYDFKFDFKDLAFIDDNQASLLSNVEVKPYDILLNITGASVARCCIVPKEILPARVNQHVAIVRVNSELADPHYILYSLNSYPYKENLLTIAQGGATREALTKDKIENFNIVLPPLATQREISSILSAYDDLIENNTRRIKILEEIAQAIYKEWFVNFRFPGHEKVKMVDSELGKIPEGWGVKTFSEVSTNFDSKRIPLSSMKRSEMKGNYPYYGAAKILDYINDYIFDGRYLLIAEDGSVITHDGKPVLQLVNGKFWANNHTHVIQGKLPIPTEFLYLYFSNFSISGYITGAAQPKITQTNLNRIPVPIPNHDLLHKFNETVKKQFDEVYALERKNMNLQNTRDLLLPKLISGDIDVEDFDIGEVSDAS